MSQKVKGSLKFDEYGNVFFEGENYEGDSKNSLSKIEKMEIGYIESILFNLKGNPEKIANEKIKITMVDFFSSVVSDIILSYYTSNFTTHYINFLKNPEKVLNKLRLLNPYVYCVSCPRGNNLKQLLNFSDNKVRRFMSRKDRMRQDVSILTGISCDDYSIEERPYNIELLNCKECSKIRLANNSQRAQKKNKEKRNELLAYRKKRREKIDIRRKNLLFKYGINELAHPYPESCCDTESESELE